MGLFSKSDVEQKLEEIYIPIFQTTMCMSSSQGKQHFRTMLKMAKEESEMEGTSNLPLNFGDIILEKESTDETTKTKLAKLRNEGVRNEDIRWWYNMHDLERKMMVVVDENNRLAIFTKSIEEGMTGEEASKKTRKHLPMFGDPDDTTHTIGKDRPLPIELKDRINIYVERRSQGDNEQFKKDIEKASTFNALIREDVEKGNI